MQLLQWTVTQSAVCRRNHIEARHVNNVSGIRPFKQRKRLRVVQAGAVAVVAMILLAGPVWDSHIHEIIETTGLAMVLACIFGRLWSILYVGGRKNQELVTTGPYSMMRNPLYFFSMIGAVGIGLIFGSIIAALVLGLLTSQVFAITAAKEAVYLKAKFGGVYETYAGRTPLFWPNLEHYQSEPDGVFSAGALRRTFIDGMYFLAIFPAIEAVEWLKLNGFLPVLLKLY